MRSQGGNEEQPAKPAAAPSKVPLPNTRTPASEGNSLCRQRRLRRSSGRTQPSASGSEALGFRAQVPAARGHALALARGRGRRVAAALCAARTAWTGAGPAVLPSPPLPHPSPLPAPRPARPTLGPALVRAPPGWLRRVPFPTRGRPLASELDVGSRWRESPPALCPFLSPSLGKYPSKT